MKHKFYKGSASENSKVFRFYKSFSPAEVSILMFLYDQPGCMYGTYADMTRMLGKTERDLPNVRARCQKLADKGWITIEPVTLSEKVEFVTKFTKKLSLSAKFVEEFL